MSDFTKNNTLYLLLLIVPLSIVNASLVLYASTKVIVAFGLFQILVIFYINVSHFAKIVFPIIMITFPVTLQVMGKDAFSTGTLIIFFTLAWSLSKHKISKTIANDKLIFKFLALIACIAFVGMISKTPPDYWGPAVRHYVNLISSIAVFILIIHSQNIAGIAHSKNEYIEKIIGALLFIVVVHVFLSFILFNFPFIEKYFTIFLNREQEFLGGHVRDGFYTRATSIFTGGEEFGELLVLLFPFALYKIFTSRKKIYSLVLGAFLLGAIISGTRSAFLLIIFQVITFVYILVPKKYNTQKIVISVTLVTIILLMFPVIFKYSFILVERLRMTVELTGHNNDITSMVNRSMVWPPAYALTISTISLFGHGPTQAHVLGYPVYNFHCLYLSLIFQLGIIGSIVFLFFLFILVKRLWNSLRTCKIQEKEYLLVVTCLLSLICFLINEIKFEFNRSDSYQQFVWICFAIFCLIGLQNREYKIEKN